MSYEEFRRELIEILKDFYGGDAQLGINETVKGNGQKKYSLWIRVMDEKKKLIPMIDLKHWYEKYLNGDSLQDCVGDIVDFMRDYQCISFFIPAVFCKLIQYIIQT